MGIGVVLSVIVSGCLNPNPWRDDSDDPLKEYVSAAKWRQVAQLEAEKWRPEANPWLVDGMEPAHNWSGSESIYAAPPPHADRHVGDGKTTRWLYGFFVKSNGGLWDVLLLSYDSNGTVVKRYERKNAESLLESPWSREYTLSPWAVDSDRAAAIVASAEPTFATCLAAIRATAVWTLSERAPGSPTWVVRLYGEGLEAGAWAVDAVSGAYLGPTVQYSCVRPDREMGTFQGALDVVNPRQVHGLRLNASTHEFLGLAIRTAASPIPQTYNVTLRDSAGAPAGLEGFNSISCPALASCFHMSSVKEPKPGNWAVEVNLIAGARLEYQLNWCALGDPRQTLASGTACREVYSKK